MWYEDYFIQLADKLYQKKIFDYIYLICGPDKSYLADNIINNSKRDYFINCSKKDLGGIILALKNSNFFVGNNSGPLNLAAALKVPSFGLIANDPVGELKFSKINIITPENYDNIRCRERNGMKKLSVERVFAKILEHIK
jgi:ADP-heptose:LPS heptosyltransferase